MDNSPTNNVTVLPVDLLRPNPWNPNQMTEAEYQELITEVRRLGRVPKPIVVRSKGDHYEIIDGEHNWQAAQVVGLTELLCEVIEAADLLKLAIVRVHRALPPDCKLLLTVHDSILLETPVNHINEVADMLRREMEVVPAGFSVPIRVDVKAGSSWGSARRCNLMS